MMAANDDSRKGVMANCEGSHHSVLGANVPNVLARHGGSQLSDWQTEMAVAGVS